MAQYSFASVRAGYRDLWDRMNVLKLAEANSQARKVIAAKARYKAVEETTGVPWFVIGCLHQRESNGNFNTWLHNGDPMRRNGVPVRTVQVPKGRPPDPNVSWEEGAYDALVTVEHLDEITDWGPEHVAYAAEKFNGWGYRSPARNIPSPYLWGGTNVQKRGKFVRDGVYDPSVMDSQLGAMAVLKQIMEMDASARFGRPAQARAPQPPAEPEVDITPPLSPPARDTEGEVKPLRRSKTIWGAILGFFSTIGTALAGFFAQLGDSPVAVILVVALIVAGGIGLYLVIKGRIDVGRIVRHLSEDD